MLGYFWFQAIVDKWYLEDKGWLNLLNTFMPTVVYAIVIAILNAIYRKIATYLNEFGKLILLLCVLTTTKSCQNISLNF
jgi:hypothetical protein